MYNLTSQNRRVLTGSIPITPLFPPRAFWSSTSALTLKLPAWGQRRLVPVHSLTSENLFNHYALWTNLHQFAIDIWYLLTKHCSADVLVQVTSISVRHEERVHFIEKIIFEAVFALTLYSWTRQSALFKSRLSFIIVLYLPLSGISSAQAIWLSRVRNMAVIRTRFICLGLPVPVSPITSQHKVYNDQ